MVQNLSDKIIFMSKKHQNNEHVSKEAVNETLSLYSQLSQKNNLELFTMLKKAKNKELRRMLVFLLGEKKPKKQEIIQNLQRLAKCDHSIIRKEAIWSLAKTGEKIIAQDLLTVLINSSNEADKHFSAYYLQDIGSESAIIPLIKISSQYRSATGITAGAVIHKIINRIGPQPLLDALNHTTKTIRIEAIWILSARIQFISCVDERTKILACLEARLAQENDLEVKTVLAYNLCELDNLAGVRELLVLCLNNELPAERLAFFWETVVHFYIKRQKELSLFLIQQLNETLQSEDVSVELQIPNKINKVITQLEKSIKGFDKIFDFLL
jgi:hypothetical protein